MPTDRIEISAENVDDLISAYEDEWWDSIHFEEVFEGISRAELYAWSADGRVRRRAIDKDRQGSRRTKVEFNVVDAVLVRSQARTLKAFLRRTRSDGNTEYRCNSCEVWKPGDRFYDNPGYANHGKHSRCKKCQNSRAKEIRIDRGPVYRVYKAETSRRQRNKLLAAARSASGWHSAKEVESNPIVDLLDRLFVGKTDVEVCREAGVHEDTVRNLRRRRSVNVGTVDRLLTGLELFDERDSFHAELEAGRPAWHHEYPYCQKCLRVSVRFMARGLCETCYPHRDNPDYVPMVERVWALRHAHCIECGTRSRKHAANGRCSACDGRYRRRAAKLRRVSSVHADTASTTQQAPDHLVGRGDDSGRISGDTSSDDPPNRGLAEPGTGTG